MANGQRWTDVEEQAIARLYHSMIETVESGERLNKAAMIRAAREGVLGGRSHGSIEYKLMNVTQWCLKLGLPVVVGYAPYGNAAGSIGAHVREVFKGAGCRVNARTAVAPLKSLKNRTEYSDHLPTAGGDA